MVDNQHSSHPSDLEEHGELAGRLGRNLATRRKELQLTQAQVAERLGVDTETLSRFERGKHLPSLLTLERLARMLRTTCGALLGETPPPPSSDAQNVDAWLAGLGEDDAAFAKRMLKACCDHLAKR